jgi:hypothetical protein
MTPPSTPDGRFLIAFDANTFAWNPTWTRLDNRLTLRVAGYTIDRGRQFELDRTDGGRAVVELHDRVGVLDPTNPTGEFYGKLEPLKQARIGRLNPITGVWQSRFRGFIEDFDYSFDPSQKVNRVTISLVDLYEPLQAIEMQPGAFGHPPPEESSDQVFFDNQTVQARIQKILTDAGIPADWWIIFTGNVNVKEAPYSPGESPLSALQEAADAEWPGVANVYVDRWGRLKFHGRNAKFDPAGAASSAGDDNWDYVEWEAGDGAAVAALPGNTAHVREFAFNHGLSKVINHALATPRRLTPLTSAEIGGQLVTDSVSIGLRGTRSWSAQDLLTDGGLGTPATTDLEETRRFAEYYVANYKDPRNRITSIGFRSMQPGQPGAGANWAMINRVDIADTVEVTVDSPGGGGFNLEPFFVEGLHEQVRPLNDDYDDVTLTLDLSPRAYFTSNPWAGPGE